MRLGLKIFQSLAKISLQTENKIYNVISLIKIAA